MNFVRIIFQSKIHIKQSLTLLKLKIGYEKGKLKSK